MKLLTAAGAIDPYQLSAELRAALGDAGNPQRWYVGGETGVARVFYVEDILDATVQAVLDAHLAAAPKRATNTPLDAQIQAIETAAPFSHRSYREGFYGLFYEINQVIAAINVKLAAVQTEVRLIPGHELFALPAIPAVTAPFGMQKVKQVDDAIVVLRNQRV